MEGALKNATETLFGKHHFEDSGIDGSIILINVSEKFGANMCTGSQWVGTGSIK
jgi:hypothetical protein